MVEPGVGTRLPLKSQVISARETIRIISLVDDPPGPLTVRRTVLPPMVLKGIFDGFCWVLSVVPSLLKSHAHESMKPVLVSVKLTVSPDSRSVALAVKLASGAKTTLMVRL